MKEERFRTTSIMIVPQVAEVSSLRQLIFSSVNCNCVLINKGHFASAQNLWQVKGFNSSEKYDPLLS